MVHSSRLPAVVVAALVLADFPAFARDGGAERLAPALKQSAPEITYRPGTIILKLDAAVANLRGDVSFGIPALDAIMERLGVYSRRALIPAAPYSASPRMAASAETHDQGFDRIYVLEYMSPYDAKWAADELQGSGVLEFAEPYYIFPLSYNPNDPTAIAQYWLRMIQAQQAWDITKGDSTVTVAITDTGVDWAHEDLAENIFTNPGETGKDAQNKDRQSNGIDDDGNGYIDDWHGWDLVGNPTLGELQSAQYHPDNNAAPHKVNVSGYEGYHGTAVAGCASARADNGKGIAGPGFYTKILPVKCASDSIGTNSVLAGYDGIVYAATLGARVINCSWGGEGNAQSFQALQSVIDFAYTRGALVVAAAGNFSTNNDVTPQIPGNLKHVLSVGATNEQDSAAGFSHYGVSVGVWAPGNNILTTMPDNLYQASNVSGTSFSSPIVAGVAGLLFGQHPDWTPDQVAMQLRATGDRVKVRFPQYSPFFFHRVNAFRAVSINNDLASGAATNLPGIGLLSYTINGKAIDTIKSVNQTVQIELTLKNYLAPTRNLQVQAVAGQALTTSPLTVKQMGTLETSTQTIEARIDTTVGLLYSEGNIQMVLQLNDGAYEDYVALSVPISIPGWHQQMNPTQSSIAPYVGGGIKALSPTSAWTVANVQTSQTTSSAIFSRTTNAGTTWLNFQTVPPGSEPLYCITAIDEQHAWSGSGPTSGQAGVFRTSNGGATWQRTSVSSITPFVNSVHFYDANNGILLGDPVSGKWGIGTTTDGGVTWSPLASPLSPVSGTEAGWNNSYAAMGDTLWFGSNSGRIYRSTNRGQTWTSALAPTLNSLGLAFADSKRGLATFSTTTTTGGSNMIAATTDGGTTWKGVTMPFANADPQGVTFVPGTMRAFVGTQNGIFQTTDLGATWKQVPTPIMTYAGMLLSAATDAEGNIGAYGTNIYSQLMTYREDAPTSTNSVPQTNAGGMTTMGMLYPVVPNPLSSTATISFELRGSSDVMLTLRDAQGRTLRTVASGRMSAGAHSVVLDAEGLASGTYFCTLAIGNQQMAQQVIVVR
jgi:subtilisin family serine protease